MLLGQYAYTFESLVRWRVSVWDKNLYQKNLYQKGFYGSSPVTGSRILARFYGDAGVDGLKKIVGLCKCFVNFNVEWGQKFLGTGRSLIWRKNYELKLAVLRWKIDLMSHYVSYTIISAKHLFSVFICVMMPNPFEFLTLDIVTQSEAWEKNSLFFRWFFKKHFLFIYLFIFLFSLNLKVYFCVNINGVKPNISLKKAKYVILLQNI